MKPATTKKTSKKIEAVAAPATHAARSPLSLNVRATRAALGATGKDADDRAATAGDLFAEFLNPYREGEESAIYSALDVLSKEVETCRLANLSAPDDTDVTGTLFSIARRLVVIAKLHGKILDKAEELHQADLASAMQGRVAS